MGAHYRIYDEKDFLKSIEQLKNKTVNEKIADKNISKEYFYTDDFISENFLKITSSIQKANPEKKLEYFIADIFENIKNPKIAVTRNGSGWGTDNGTDLILDVTTSVVGLEISNKIVVQIKSYTESHWETNAVKQVETGLDIYKADAGILITTAKATEKLIEKIEKLQSKTGKPIKLIAGKDVAVMVLKYGNFLEYC